MIGVARADPADAGFLRQLHGEIGGVGHDQMADTVVAVDQRGRGRALQRLDVGLGIDAAGLQRTEVEAKAEDTVRIEAGEIGFDHLLCGNRGVGRRHATGDQRVARKRDHRSDGETLASAIELRRGRAR